MRSLLQTPFLLLSAGTALTLIQLQHVWQTNYYMGLEPYLISYGAVWFSLWNRRSRLHFESTLPAIAIGFLCLIWVLVRSAPLDPQDYFLRCSPFISGIGLALIASGFSKFKQYLNELLVLSAIMVPATTIAMFLKLHHITAGMVTLNLQLLGYDTIQQGARMVLPMGYVDVNMACSGAQLIMYLLTLVLVFITLFSFTKRQIILLSIVAVCVGFIVNCVRITLIAYLFARSNMDGFNYWHDGRGSLIFSMIAVLIFGSICYRFPQSNSSVLENNV